VDDRHFSYITKMKKTKKKQKKTLLKEKGMSNDYGSVKSALVQRS
jgi:hypothetical protein